MGGGEVLKKGWLVKSPPLEGGGMKSWRKRFFLLRSSKILEYYKCENGDIKGVVNLEDCVSVHADLFHKKYKHVFDIQTRDRTYYLVAPSAEEMNTWVNVLCQLCNFTTQEATKASRCSSTLPGNFSVVKTPLPEPPPPPPSSTHAGSKFSPEMEKYMLSPEVVELLRCKPKNSIVPSGIPLQDALVQKGLANHHSRTFSYPNSLRMSTGSSIDSPAISQRSSQDPEYFSTRFSTSSTDGQSDSSSLTYDTPTNNQLAHNVPSHYDVPRSSLSVIPSSNGGDRAQMLSNNYMVPRLARMSDPLYNYDYLPPPRPVTADGLHPLYDYPPKRESSLSLRSEILLPPRSDIPLPPRSENPLRPRSDLSYSTGLDVPSLQPPLFNSQGQNIYDVPPHPRPLFPNDVYNVPPPTCVPTPPSTIPNGPRRPSIETTDCPTPQQANLLPPPIIFRRDSKGSEDEMIPNKMYEMVWANNDFKLSSDDKENTSAEQQEPKSQESEEDSSNDDDGRDGREELEETLTTAVNGGARQYVNLCMMEEEAEVPPPIDRSLKPGAPPKIDRSSKPKVVNEDIDGGNGFVPELPIRPRKVSLQELCDNEENTFSPKEIPRLTSHSVHYTQVSFLDRKKPVPTPRSNRTPNCSPQRVQYCHIDINAMNNSSNESNIFCNDDVDDTPDLNSDVNTDPDTDVSVTEDLGSLSLN